MARVLYREGNVNLTNKLKRFALVHAASRTPEREDREYAAKQAALRAAIDEGDASGIAEGDSFARVRRTLKLSTKRQ